MISTQFPKPINIVCIDNAMEYKNSLFLDFIHTQGTLIQSSCPGKSQQNGRVVCKNCHILYSVMAFLIFALCIEWL